MHTFALVNAPKGINIYLMNHAVFVLRYIFLLALLYSKDLMTNATLQPMQQYYNFV